MKLSVAASALALCASASAIRLIQLEDAPADFAPRPFLPAPPAPQREDIAYASPPIWPWHKPCAQHRPSSLRQFMTSVLETFHRSPPPRPHVYDFDIEGLSAEHVEELMRTAKARIEEIEKAGVPIMEGGMVKILPFEIPGSVEDSTPAGKWRDEDDREEWRMRGWRQKHHHHHHHLHDGPEGHAMGRGRGRMYWRHHHSFGARLAHALRHLSTPEIIALIFVLGVGTGSLLHVGIVLFIVFFRISRRGGLQACRERRAARRAARAERKAAKKAAKMAEQQGKEGQIRLEGEEQPPRYEDNSVDVQEKV